MSLSLIQRAPADGRPGGDAGRRRSAAIGSGAATARTADRHTTTSLLNRVLGKFGYVPRQKLQDAESRAQQASRATARCETALRTANAYVFSQDRNLRYTWAYSPHAEAQGTDLIGRSDEEILPPRERDAVMAIKRKVLETGQPAQAEVSYPTPNGRALFT